MDLTILVDGSASISMDEYAVMITFLKDLVGQMAIGSQETQIQLVTYSSAYSQRLNFKDGSSAAGVVAGLDYVIKSVSFMVSFSSPLLPKTSLH